MTSQKPYLLRALYEWIVDNGLTPYIVVDARDGRVQVPAAYVQNGHIVLNLAPHSVVQLKLGNDEIGCHARFSGTGHELRIPLWAVRSIYARENGQGMVFAEDEPPPAPDPGEAQARRPERPKLKVVK